MSRVIVLGSVFLPPVAMEPFARTWVHRGHDVTVIVPQDTGSVEAVLGGYVTQITSGAPPIVVVHSNGGNYVPGTISRIAVAGVVFVDAVLPPFDGGRWQVVPSALGAQLSDKAVDGALPRWARWWPESEMRPLFRDGRTFDRIHAVTPEIDASYLSGVIEASADWASALPAAYLALGDTYAPELDRAAAAGWPTDRLDLDHLGLSSSPEAVVNAIESLLSRLDRRPTLAT